MRVAISLRAQLVAHSLFGYSRTHTPEGLGLLELLHRSDKEVIGITSLVINKAKEGVEDVVRACHTGDLKERVPKEVGLVRYICLRELLVPCRHLYKALGCKH